jgi:hypothetical protein
MTCKHGVVIHTEIGTEYDCALALPVCCEDCPFGAFPYNALLLWIANGKAYYLDYAGNWADEKLIDHITNAFSDYVLPVLETDKEVDLAIKETKETTNQYSIIMCDIEVIPTDDDITIGYRDLIIDEVY